MAFYIPATKKGFWSNVPPDVPSEWIFYREKWAVLAAIDHAITHLGMVKQRIIIYTDNINTVDVYNTLHALPLYNQLLQIAVDLLIRSECQIRVVYIPTVRNGIADVLSHQQFTWALSYDPLLHIAEF